MTHPTKPADLTVILDKIRKNHQQHVSINFPEPGICVSRDGKWPCGAGRLLAALDEVLKLAGDLDAKAADLARQSRAVADRGGMIIPAALNGRAETCRDDARALREAVSAALLADGSHA